MTLSHPFSFVPSVWHMCCEKILLTGSIAGHAVAGRSNLVMFVSLFLFRENGINNLRQSCWLLSLGSLTSICFTISYRFLLIPPLSWQFLFLWIDHRFAIASKRLTHSCVKRCTCACISRLRNRDFPGKRMRFTSVCLIVFQFRLFSFCHLHEQIEEKWMIQLQTDDHIWIHFLTVNRPFVISSLKSHFHGALTKDIENKSHAIVNVTGMANLS